MHDHDFEKQVQQKMEALHLSPSDAVWEQVEGRLHKKKRRRGIFWIPVFFISLVLGGYYFMQHHSFSKYPALIPVNQKISSGNNKTVKTEKANPSTRQLKKALSLSSVYLHNPDTTLLGRKGRPHALPSGGVMRISVNPHMDYTTGGKEVRAGKSNLESSAMEQSGLTSAILPGSVEVPPSGEPTGSQAGSGVPRDLSAAMVSSALLMRQPVAVAPAITAGREMAVTVRLSKKSSLHWGIRLQVMRTSVNEGGLGLNKLFTGSRSADQLAFNPSNTTTPNNGSAAVPSAIRAGTGFSAGFFLRKRVAPRLALSTGIDYSLFSTSLMIGGSQNSSAAQFMSSGVGQYYLLSNSSRYTNRYHFISLPVLIQWQINRRKIPMIWEAGMSVSQLLGSNALHYSSALNGYYKNNDLLHPTQFNMVTAIYVEAFHLWEHPVKLGPQLQVGLTSLSAENAGKVNHPVQYGLSISTMIK